MIDTSALKIDVAIPAHNVANCIGPTLDAILAQELPADTCLRIHVADDGSSDGLATLIARDYASHVTLIVHPVNRGRSAACNSAIGSGDGDLVLVLDADCCLADKRMVARILDHFDAGADAVLGTVEADGKGFWGRYASLVSARRVGQAQREGAWHMTTANFAIKRRLLQQLGGFSEEYRHYGFEDRDLLIRLTRTGANIVIDSEVIVRHREPASVSEVCRKLYLSGRYSAGAFSSRFPEEYRQSAYYRFDLSRRPLLARLCGPLLTAVDPLLRSMSEWTIRQRRVGFDTKVVMLRAASAVAYLRGTCDAALERNI